jgi:hypothetical protein
MQSFCRNSDWSKWFNLFSSFLPVVCKICGGICQNNFYEVCLCQTVWCKSCIVILYLKLSNVKYWCFPKIKWIYQLKFAWCVQSSWLPLIFVIFCGKCNWYKWFYLSLLVISICSLQNLWWNSTNPIFLCMYYQILKSKYYCYSLLEDGKCEILTFSENKICFVNDFYLFLFCYFL